MTARGDVRQGARYLATGTGTNKKAVKELMVQRFVKACEEYVIRGSIRTIVQDNEVIVT